LADTTRKERAAKPSVASHPLFPIVVVLWFGALFGLVSLAIRPVMIESLVSTIGLDRVIPMAAPPLGSTARLLVALSMTLLGFAVGAIVGRILTKPATKPASTRRRHPVANVPAEETPSPVALFGAEPADQEEDEPARRRRQLAIVDAGESSDDHAPLPGNSQILSVTELPLKSFDEVDEIWLHSSDRAKPRADDTADLAQDIEAVDEAEWHEAVAPVASSISSHDDEDDAAFDSEGPSNRLFDSYVRRVNASVGAKDPSVPAPGFVLIADQKTSGAADSQEQEMAASGDQPAPDSPQAEEPATDPVYANTAERIATAPLDTLSHVELLERLAQTIARRRAAAAAQASQVAAVCAPSAEPVWFSAPQTVGAQGQLPAALRPQWADDADEDSEALPVIAPPRTMTMTSMTAVAGTDKAATMQDGVQDNVAETAASTPEDPQVLDEGYASLLGVTRMNGRQMFGHNDASSASIAPSDPAPISAPAPRAFDAPTSGELVPDLTEQALRAALATLRRMSGAA
jgi:hypothetical protein